MRAPFDPESRLLDYRLCCVFLLTTAAAATAGENRLPPMIRAPLPAADGKTASPEDVARSILLDATGRCDAPPVVEIPGGASPLVDLLEEFRASTNLGMWIHVSEEQRKTEIVMKEAVMPLWHALTHTAGAAKGFVYLDGSGVHFVVPEKSEGVELPPVTSRCPAGPFFVDLRSFASTRMVDFHGPERRGRQSVIALTIGALGFPAGYPLLVEDLSVSVDKKPIDIQKHEYRLQMMPPRNREGETMIGNLTVAEIFVRGAPFPENAKRLSVSGNVVTPKPKDFEELAFPLRDVQPRMQEAGVNMSFSVLEGKAAEKLGVAPGSYQVLLWGRVGLNPDAAPNGWIQYFLWIDGDGRATVAEKAVVDSRNPNRVMVRVPPEAHELRVGMATDFEAKSYPFRLGPFDIPE